MDELLIKEFDIRYINAVSRKDLKEHAMIRLIISSLATHEEVYNLTKNDIRSFNGIKTVKLNNGRKTRIAPIDSRTFEVLMEVSKGMSRRQRIFDYSKAEMDEIVKKYSPAKRTYNVEKLRSAVIDILRDCQFFEHDYVSDMINGTNFEGVVDFVNDMHPMFSGVWDLDDDEVAEDFIENYILLIGERNAEKIAEDICESVERVENLMRSITSRNLMFRI
ncbi:hypothetical protein [Archaeoglobus profundus]|uniref:Uncharacterized protein n=1 Tax=Archaeoglobus profundus (strain DSM 5631 / JCM 9629 / NBRC 100127 / Av18) TaxID=572546 RepID=D2RFX5_ARCPA|nr:hypothetical protein [Archaeoglobus profundus]ADB57200.1 hypothetical protein Arcpr_0128 [Archaeoglobus profundus DSM 5631]